jgi:hypothetical protein
MREHTQTDRTLSQRTSLDDVAAGIRRLVCNEFAVMEACQRAAEDAEAELRARLLNRAGLCQVHMFDLESGLRALGGAPTGYANCARMSLTAKSWHASLAELLGRYRCLSLERLPNSLRALIEENVADHLGQAREKLRRAA